MPDVARPLSLVRDVADMKRALARLRPPPREIPFSYPGALTVSTSPPWTPRVTGTLTEVRCLLGTAGTSDTVVAVYKNGTSIGTVTVPAGETNVMETFSTQFIGNTDVLTVGVTTAGTDSVDLVTLARF